MAISDFQRIYQADDPVGSYSDHYLLADKSGNAAAVKVPVSDFVLDGEEIFIGTNMSSGDDAALLIGRAAVNPLASGGSHGVRDESTYYYAAGGYASFDAIPVAGGAGGMNHLNCFQARPQYNGVGTLDAIWGMTFQPTIFGPVTNCYGVYVLNPILSGAGDIDGVLTGIYIEELSGGDLGSYAIYVAGNNPAYFGGSLQTAGDVTCGGNVTADNFVSRSINNTLLIGEGVTTADVYLDLAVGYNAGHSMASGAEQNTLIGNNAAYSLTTGDRNTILGYDAGYLMAATATGNVFIGYRSGYYETGSDKFFVDNQHRETNEADCRAKALLYGVFASTIAGQSLSINADLDHNGDKVGFYGTAPIAQAVLATGAGATVDNVITALQNLGLVKQS